MTFCFFFTSQVILHYIIEVETFWKNSHYFRFLGKGPPLSYLQKKNLQNFKITSFTFKSIAEVKISTKKVFKTVLTDF